ncbi:MAG: hypothetical protein WAQ77_13505, partial [Candidatus Acidiferrum sp.]
MLQQRLFACALLLSALLAGPSVARADGSASLAASGQLGKVDFATSCAAEVQPSLEKGLALLHSFQYTESEK